MKDAADSKYQKAVYFELLENRDFSALWLARTVSALGDRLHQIALVTLVLALTGINLNDVALIWVVIGLPTLAFGLIAGALTDRWSRKRVMVNTDLLRVPIVALIPFLAHISLVWVYVLLFVLTTLGLFFRPAYRAILPDIVPSRSLSAANSLSNSSESFMDVLGYPLAGTIIVGLNGVWGNRGIEIAFFLDAASYLVSALLMLRIRSEDTIASSVVLSLSGVLRMVGGGLRVVVGNRYLLANTLLFIVGPLVGAATNTLSAGYAESVTHSGSFGYSVLEGAIGLGAVAGGLLAGVISSRLNKGCTVIAGLALMAIGLGSLSLFSNLWGAAAMLAVTGVGNMLIIVPSITLVQERVERQYLGRVFSLRSQLVALATILSNGAAGMLSQTYGTQAVLGLCGAALLVISVVALLFPAARDAD